MGCQLHQIALGSGILVFALARHEAVPRLKGCPPQLFHRWLFRSCTNHRRWLHAECPACPGRKDGMLRDGRGATELACPEHHSLCSQLQDEEERRRGLRPLWAAAGPWADRFSSNFIRRRFGPP